MSRRIIAAAGPDGKSCVVSDEAMPQTDPLCWYSFQPDPDR